MYYPRELIEEVQVKSDIVDVIGKRVALTKKGSRYVGLCPFHNEKSPSFTVTPARQMYYCFGCHAGGDVFSFLKEYENLTFPEALKELADDCGVELPEGYNSPEAKLESDKRTAILEINRKAANYFYYQLRKEQGKLAYTYLKDRNLSEETIQRFGLGYSNKQRNDLYLYLKREGYKDELLKESGLVTFDEKYGPSDKFWNRVMFPIMDIKNHVVGFGGRVMGDGKPKYVNTQETIAFDKSRNLYGLNYAKNSRKPNMIICEGYMDVIALHQAGFNQAVASLGTAFTAQQSAMLKRYTDEVLLAYDMDEAGTKAAIAAIAILKDAGLNVRVIRIPEGKAKDPDEYIKKFGAEAYQKLIDEAKNSFLFEIEVLERRFHMNDPGSKTAFFQAVSEKLLEFTDKIDRDTYTDAVARAYGVRPEDLRNRVDGLGRKLDPVIRREEQKAETGRRREREEGESKAERILLSYLTSDERVLREVKKHIEPDDFTVPLYKKVAERFFQEENVSLLASTMLRETEDTEEQRKLSSIFSTQMDQVETKEELEKVLRDTIIRVRKHSLDTKIKQVDMRDVAQFQRLITSQKALERLHILLIKDKI